MAKPPRRTEWTDEQVETRSTETIARIKREFETEKAVYIDKDDMKFVVGRKRDRDEVRPEFESVMLQKFDAAVVDVSGGRVAVVKR
ncbi:MAG: hypothetical protein Q7R40_15220 [Phaeospirillum sp.]|nr:hypothetical protein [Phaeospirillum sp.]